MKTDMHLISFFIVVSPLGYDGWELPYGLLSERRTFDLQFGEFTTAYQLDVTDIPDGNAGSGGVHNGAVPIEQTDGNTAGIYQGGIGDSAVFVIGNLFPDGFQIHI